MKRLILCALVGLAGCGTAARLQTAPTTANASIAIVTSTAPAITLDGRLDEPMWSKAAVRRLTRVGGDAAAESCEVMLLADDTHLYVGVRAVDLDVVQELQADQRHHYTAGDVFEVFIRPADSKSYWEYFATPGGWKTSQFYPSKGRLGLPSSFDYPSGLRVAAVVDGSLNNFRDQDAGWTAEMAIPLADVRGASSNATDFDVLFGRYNFGRQLDAVELSSWPTILSADFHNHAWHARLRIGDQSNHSTATKPSDREVQR